MKSKSSFALSIGMLALAGQYALPRVSGAIQHERIPAEGGLLTIHGQTISVRINKGVSLFLVSKDTMIWRGGTVGLKQLRQGDDLSIVYYKDTAGQKVALEIDANIANWKGVITKVIGHAIEITKEDEHDTPEDHATIIIDAHTTFDQGTPDDLQPGRSVQVVGLQIGQNRMRATTVLDIIK